MATEPMPSVGAHGNADEAVALSLGGKLTGQYAERAMRIIMQRLSAGALVDRSKFDHLHLMHSHQMCDLIAS